MCSSGVGDNALSRVGPRHTHPPELAAGLFGQTATRKLCTLNTSLLSPQLQESAPRTWTPHATLPHGSSMFQQYSLPHSSAPPAVMLPTAHSTVAGLLHAVGVTSAGERTTHSDRPSTYTPRLRSSRITRFCRSGFSRSLMTCQDTRDPCQFFAGCRASCQQPSCSH